MLKAPAAMGTLESSFLRRSWDDSIFAGRPSRRAADSGGGCFQISVASGSGNLGINLCVIVASLQKILNRAKKSSKYVIVFIVSVSPLEKAAC